MARARSTAPFSPFEWLIALRYLRPKRKEAFISVIAAFSLLGIALGVAALIIVMSVMNGFRAEIVNRILGLRGHVSVVAPGGSLTGYDEAAGRIRAVPGVVSAVPYVQGQVLATSNGSSHGAIVRGVRGADLAAMTELTSTFSTGALEGFDDGQSVIMGADMADSLRVVPGMSVTLVAPSGELTPFGMTPRVKAYRVAGTFKLGLSTYDGNLLFMPLGEAQLYFGTGAAASAIELRVTNPDAADSMLPAIERAAGRGTIAVPWSEDNRDLFDALVVERNVMFLILTIIIIVAAFNIISSLIMMVKDKSGDIAILRTMGATRGAVMRVFFIAGATIGVAGTLIGFLLGVLVCANIETLRQLVTNLSGTDPFNKTVYFLSTLPAKIDPMEVALVVAIALGLSFLATVYPSWRAARLDPVEALRYE